MNNINLGYSDRINDSAFKEYVKKAKNVTILVTLILPIIFIVGFYIFGQFSNSLKNPLSLIIGVFLAIVTLIVGLKELGNRKKTLSWDGVIVDKVVQDKKRTNADYTEKYKLYTITIRDGSNKDHLFKIENNQLIYDYYNIGDKVRYHAGLDAYEKYDKTKDNTILCVACKTMNDIDKDNCSKCGSPLLK